ncbi:MAG: long-chain fatty acid--CoA ligase [Melioribacteraceae bacterium]|nr:long-chain fatty acid--CoA ligase [Melioribacteraceae bacterium]
MAIYRDFKTIPELFTNIVDSFNGQSRTCIAHKVNGKYVGISYEEVWDNTESFALGLVSLGIKKEDKVAIISENRPEWLYTDMGVIGLGAIDVPLYPILTADSIQFILNNSEAKSIVVSNKFHLNKVLKVRKNLKYLKSIIVMNEIEDMNEPDVYSFRQIQQMGSLFKNENPTYFKDNSKLVGEEDLCTIIYTSGTTGEPKGVMLTNKNICSNVKAANEVFGFDDTDVFLSFLPLCHIFERMGGYYTPFSAGSQIYYAESIEKVATNLIEVSPTIMTAVPRFFERLYSKIKRNIDNQSPKKQKIFNWALEVGRDYAQAKNSTESIPVSLTLKHKLADKLVYSKLKEKTGGKLRFFVSGGAALPREHGEFFEAIGIIILEGYGLTESSPVLTANSLNNYKFGSIGHPVPGVEIKIAKDGEILAYGPNIMKGYYKNKKETEATIKDGWLHTGDIGVFDAQGFLIITDRKKHLFKTSGGKYVAPTPIENMFLASKYIEQFVLIGDRRMFLTALIVPDFEALKEYADANRIQYTSEEDLVNLKQINELLETDFKFFQKNLANFEKVRRFTLLDKPFTIEDGELTPTLKVKRKIVEERYGELIDDMYKALREKS